MPAKKTITKSTHVAKRIVVDENGKERILHGFGWGKKKPHYLDVVAC